MEKSDKALYIFSFIGVVMGVVSFYINEPVINLVLMLLIGYILKMIVERVLDIKEKFKWWMTNGFFAYIFVWFVVWTMLYNIQLFG